MQELLGKLSGKQWEGSGELWLDPGGNDVKHYTCDLTIEDDGIKYTWFYEGAKKHGSLIFNEDGAVWQDSWHQPEPVQCSNIPEAWGIFTVFYAYEVSDNSNWGWRTKLSERPDASLVLQMTNIAPWGEEGRAVRMVFTSKNNEQSN